MTLVLLTPSVGAAAAAITQSLTTQGMKVEAAELNLAELNAGGAWQDCHCVLASAADFLGYRRNQPGAPPLTKPVVVIVDKGQVREAVQCIQQGAADYLEAIAQQDEIAPAIERATQVAVQPPQSAEPQANDFNMLGECPAIKRLRHQVHKVANTDSTVLILGEPGTGKELVARALHRASTRATRPLITLNCAAVPANLVDAELFGGVTATGEQSTGLIQAADGGTLFLDEVAELPMEAQTRLLSVVEDLQVRPVGSNEYRAVNVRLIAATHRSLERLAEGGNFRADLYYRLSVFTLEAPPLRHREQDSLLLANEFASSTAQRLGRAVPKFDADAQTAILEYNWPGNVRELVNVVERGVILCSDEQITPAELAIDNSKQPAPTPVDESGLQDDPTSLEDYFVKFVTEHQDGLTETQLAERLGISRKSLWERRQRLNIPRKRTKKRGPRREGS